jgi:hypothetical protein
VFTVIVVGVILVALLIFWIRRRRRRASPGEHINGTELAKQGPVDVAAENGLAAALRPAKAAAEETTAQHSREE